MLSWAANTSVTSVVKTSPHKVASASAFTCLTLARITPWSILRDPLTTCRTLSESANWGVVRPLVRNASAELSEITFSGPMRESRLMTSSAIPVPR